MLLEVHWSFRFGFYFFEIRDHKRGISLWVLQNCRRMQGLSGWDWVRLAPNQESAYWTPTRKFHQPKVPRFDDSCPPGERNYAPYRENDKQRTWNQREERLFNPDSEVEVISAASNARAEGLVIGVGTGQERHDGEVDVCYNVNDYGDIILYVLC